MPGQNYNRRGGGNQNRDRAAARLPDFKSVWITNGITEETIEYARKTGKILARNLSTSQIRNVYGEMKRIQMKGFDSEKTLSFF